MKTAALMFIGLACAASFAQAQSVRGVLVSAADSQPIPYGTIVGPDGTGRFADATGHFTLGELRDGTYQVRARMIGYSPLDTTIVLGPARAPLELRISPSAIRLATVPVTARRNKGCVAMGIPSAATSPQLAAVFDQLKINIERYDILLDQYPFHYRRAEQEVIETPGQRDSAVWADTALYDSRDRRPYHVGSMVFSDRTVDGKTRLMMYLPTFADLGDSAFDAAHCFYYRGREKDEIRIDFQPADRIAQSDVRGSIFLDADRYIVKRAIFDLTKPRLASRGTIAMTATTTFQEVLPLVPILAITKTNQPLNPTRNKGWDAHTAGRSPTGYDTHPLLQHTAVETDVVLDHTFLSDEVGQSQVAEPQELPAPKVTVTLGCSLPPSFETTDIPIYGTVGGVTHGDPNNDRLTLGIRHQFHLPDNLSLPVYGFEFDSKVAPTLTGEVAFTLSRGRVQSLAVTATSLLPAADSALVMAVRRADSLKAFVGVPAGRYTVSLSSAKPDPDALAVDLAHIAVPVLPLAHKAQINYDAGAPRLPTGTGTFMFVVDEHGHAMPNTMVTVKSSSAAFAAAVGNELDKLQFEPAVSGTCAIKQVVQQPIQATWRSKVQ